MVPKDLKLSGFANDHSIRKPFKANSRKEEITTKQDNESCMLNIKNWMDTIHLKMNPPKTEFIHFGNQIQLNKCTVDSLQIGDDLVLRSEVIRYLGIWLDQCLTFKHHVTKKCQAAMLNFLKIRSIHHLLMTEITASLCLSLCISHLDYGNSVLYGLPEVTISHLQRIQMHA